MQAGYESAVNELFHRLVDQLENELVSLAVFGSVARGKATPPSDVDVLIVIRHLPSGVMRRMKVVDPATTAAEAVLQKSRPHAVISPVLRTPEEVERGGPLFYDMTVPGEIEILHDPQRFLVGYLDRLREKMKALGARRYETMGRTWWDLKPDFRPGDIIDL